MFSQGYEVMTTMMRPARNDGEHKRILTNSQGIAQDVKHYSALSGNGPKNCIKEYELCECSGKKALLNWTPDHSPQQTNQSKHGPVHLMD
jgi:hypothetical protein